METTASMSPRAIATKISASVADVLRPISAAASVSASSPPPPVRASSITFASVRLPTSLHTRYRSDPATPTKGATPGHSRRRLHMARSSA